MILRTWFSDMNNASHFEGEISRFPSYFHAGCSGIMYYMYEMDSKKVELESRLGMI